MARQQPSDPPDDSLQRPIPQPVKDHWELNWTANPKWRTVDEFMCHLSLFGKYREAILAIGGIDGQIAHGDTFHNDRFPDLKADFILANPPFNVSDWGGERLREDKRWQYGVLPATDRRLSP